MRSEWIEYCAPDYSARRARLTPVEIVNPGAPLIQRATDTLFEVETPGQPGLTRVNTILIRATDGSERKVWVNTHHTFLVGWMPGLKLYFNATWSWADPDGTDERDGANAMEEHPLIHLLDPRSRQPFPIRFPNPQEEGRPVFLVGE